MGKRRQMSKSTLEFASLFSGCGGFDLGFISKGFRSVGAYDFDKDAVSNFSANISSEIVQADLTKGVPNEDAIRNTDVLIAGPPCQGFSTAGKRELNDERNHLLSLTGEIAQSIKPKVLVVENVAGALSGNHAKYFKHLELGLRESGYQTHMLKIQTSDLGMGQLRKRVLLFAWNTKRNADFSLKQQESGNLRSALKGISNTANHNPTLLKENSKDWLIAQRIKAGQKLSNVRGGKNSIATWDIPEVFGSISEHEITVLEMLRRLRRRERLRKYGDADPVSLDRLEDALGPKFCALIDGLVTKGYLRALESGIDLAGTFNGKYRRLSWDRPSCTVDTRFGAPRYFLHPTKHRGFTVREAARIQGFPDDYRFLGSEAAQYRVIGNAVPPPLGEYAANISKQLLGVSS